MVSLQKITEDNFQACVGLSVREDQNNFVAPNIRSFAQAWLHYDVARPFAIYDDETLVGFLMLWWDEKKDDCYVWRLMIDRRYQRRGHGRAALRLAMAMMREHGFKTASLSHEVENAGAHALYESLGFALTGEVDEDGEVGMKAAL